MEGLDLEGEKQSDLLITIDGQSGAGKGVLAEHIAEQLNVNYYSAGNFFRNIAEEKGCTVQKLSKEADKNLDLEIDRRTFQKGLKEDCVIESRIACHVLKDYSDYKIRLKAGLEERAQRVSEREDIGVEEAKQHIKERDRDNKKRYREYYGLDMDNLDGYDLILDNTDLTVSETNQIVMKALQTAVK